MWVWLILLSLISALEEAAEPLRCIYDSWNADRPIRSFAPPPEYPEAARESEIEGRVLIVGVISSDGSIDSAQVIAFEPSSIFNESALSSFKTWRYCPLKGNMDPKVRVSLVFKLDDKQ